MKKVAALVFTLFLANGALAASSGLLVKTYTDRNIFVGNETIHITYFLLMKAGVSVDENSFVAAKFGPFEVVSIAQGGSTTIPGIKDFEVKKVVVAVRLAQDEPYGFYVVPSFKINYEYDEVIIGQDNQPVKTRVKKYTGTKEIKFEKVPVYVETDALHEVVHIGDTVRQRLTIHADNKTEILNEFSAAESKEGITYLSAFSLEEPLAVLSVAREEDNSMLYRIIEYVYTFSVLDIQAKPYKVEMPKVLWRVSDSEDASKREVNTISPGPVYVEVRSILKKDTAFEPQKGVYAEPAHERALFFTMPLVVTVSIVVLIASCLLYRLVVFLRSLGKEKKEKIDEKKAVKPVYENSILSRWRLKKAVDRALAGYNAEPSEGNCIKLREVLARYAVAYLRKKNRIDKVTACAMTATALKEALGTKAPGAIALLSEVDSQLETASYSKLGSK